MADNNIKLNAAQFPRMLYARHMQPGIVQYENETVLVDTDAVKLMIPTAIGMPVYIEHDLNSEQDRLKNLEKDPVGFITESFYNELDGWLWFKIIVTKDEGHAAIAKGWSVSNAYLIKDWGAGGTKNNVPYKREILSGKFTHLAIVPNPRYEEACIMSLEDFRNYQDVKKRQLEELHNSKTTEGKPMFKLFKTSKEEVKTVDADTMVELEGGQTVTIQEMLNAVKKNSDDEEKKKKEEEEKANGDQMVECGGEKMPLKELINRYSKMNEKKNADEEEEKKKKEAEEKKNADEEAEKKKKEKEEEEKKNATFEELRNAHNKGQEPVVMVETSMEKIVRGQQRYGSPA